MPSYNSFQGKLRVRTSRGQSYIYERKYQDLAEVTARFRNVQASLKRAAQQQAKNPHAKFGLTQFSDLSIEEFKRYNGYKRTSARRNDPLPSFQSGITPDAFDWRENKGVSPVKNQALCGSSYAFGAVAAIESQYLVKKGQELDLSEEDVLQCTYHAPEYGNNQGCVDGETEAILRYVRDHGIASERTDPYNPDADFPNCKKDEPVVANLSQAIQANNVDEAVLLRDIVYHVGPVAVVIDASKLVGYESGIISGTQGQWRVNRAALLVGYGEENGVKYWALKNSWGETWGEDGFFRIERGSNVMGITEEIDIAIL